MALPDIKVLTFAKGSKGYLSTNAKNGFTTFSINICSGGYEVKINNVKDLDNETKKWLGCENKHLYKKPSLDREYYSRLEWLLDNPKEAEARKIKFVPSDTAKAKARLKVIIDKAENK